MKVAHLSKLVALLTVVVNAQQPITEGQKIQFVGHSFHWFLPTPLETLAKEAGITGHETIGLDRIGGSTPMQHWEKGGAQGNAVKTALKEGRASVLTLATQQNVPEEGITLFSELAFENRKDMRVMVQETWLPINEASGGRDRATLEHLQTVLDETETPYQERLRTQLAGLNAEFGADFCYLVPVWEGVLTMRQEVLRGNIPGVTRQSQMFQDTLGHARQPLQDFVTYMWFAALYRRTPVGLKSLSGARRNPAQALALQTLAWDIITKEPLSGVTA